MLFTFGKHDILSHVCKERKRGPPVNGLTAEC
jgi:hypothetical protein